MTRGERTVQKAGRGLPKTLWAYAYEIVPQQGEAQLKAIRTLLEHEHTQAKVAGRTWTGKLVRGQEVTHILIVSDSPDQHGEINRRLAARLKQSNAAFSVSVPMELVNDEAPSPGAERPS